MSEKAAKQPNVFARLRNPANLNYLVLTGAGLLIYFFAMSSQGSDTGALIAVLLAVPGILARWVVSPILVLLLTVYLLMDPGFISSYSLISTGRWRSLPRSGGFNIEHIMLAGGMLAYFIGHFRLTTLLHQAMPSDPGFRGNREEAKPPVRAQELVAQDELPKVLFVGVGCIVLGQAAWMIVKLTERMSGPNLFGPTTSRLLILIWAIGTILGSIAAATIYLRAARMSRLEASMILRDQHFQENRRESDRIQRWRKWFKEKSAKRRRAGKRG